MFFYYVSGLEPNRTRIAREDIPAELGHAFDDLPVPRGVLCGPDSKSGVLLGETLPPGYFPIDQEWVEMGNGCWLGWIKDNLPSPAELARREQLEGANVRDDAGRDWLVPFAISYVSTPGDAIAWAEALPRTLTFTAGKWIPGEVKARYRRLWDLVQAYQQALADAFLASPETERVRFSFEPLDELAVLALATNYRIGPHELNAMGAYDDRFRDGVIAAVRGLPLLAELKKKQARGIGDL